MPGTKKPLGEQLLGAAPYRKSYFAAFASFFSSRRGDTKLAEKKFAIYTTLKTALQSNESNIDTILTAIESAAKAAYEARNPCSQQRTGTVKALSVEVSTEKLTPNEKAAFSTKDEKWEQKVNIGLLKIVRKEGYPPASFEKALSKMLDHLSQNNSNTSITSQINEIKNNYLEKTPIVPNRLALETTWAAAYMPQLSMANPIV